MPDATSARATSNANDLKGEHVFEHAPPRPAGDPWDIILKPELEADTERCNAWKEEVQNLLIFAGLFSAVVTAFVIESYKFIQPDPNAVVVGLLYHIASTSNNSLPFPPSVNPVSINAPFSSTASSMRINIFWFLSLILSLTTVLVGTISLQWLREHQSYPNFTPKEKVAILHMRLEAFDAWYVPQIFAGLPVLLQAALALFLAGMIDFALPLGVQLAVPVAVVIGVTLLFLGLTTVLPALQCISFFVRDWVYPRKTVPTPCAFKSPQSQAFRVLVGLMVAGIFQLFPKLSWHEDDGGGYVNPLPSALYHLAPSIYQLWDKANWRSWPIFDREWVSFRDACHHHIYDKDVHLFEYRQVWADEFPLSDVTQALMKITKEAPSAKHTKEFLEAAVYCFEELSKSVWTNQRTFLVACKDRCSNYFEQLLGQSSCSLSKWLIHGSVYQFNQLDAGRLYHYIKDEKTVLFHHDQMFYFLQSLLQTHSSSSLEQYCTGLWTHIMGKLNIQPLQPIHASALTPNVLQVDVDVFLRSIDSDATRYSAAANMLKGIFNAAASHQISQDQSLHSQYTQPTILDVLDSLASLSDDYLRPKQRTNTPNNPETQQFAEIDNQYTSMFRFVTEHLNKEKADATLNPEDTPSVLFYLAAIFTWKLLDWLAAQVVLSDQNSSFGQGLMSLLEELLQYRSWLGGRKNDRLETRFSGKYYSVQKHRYVGIFSEDWWAGLSYSLGDANKAIETRARAVDMISMPEATNTLMCGTSTAAHAASASPTVNVIVNVEVSDVSSPDGEHRTNTDTMHSESQAEPSTLPVPIPTNCEEVHIQQTDLDLPMTTNLILAPNAYPDSIDTPSNPFPHLTSVDPEEIRATADEGLDGSPAENVVPSILADFAQLPVSFSSSIDNGLAPDKIADPRKPYVAIEVHQPSDPEDTEVRGAADASSAALDLEAGGGDHTAIEVGVVGGAETVELAESAGGGAGHPLCDLDEADEGSAIFVAKDADASVAEGRA